MEEGTSLVWRKAEEGSGRQRKAAEGSNPANSNEYLLLMAGKSLKL